MVIRSEQQETSNQQQGKRHMEIYMIYITASSKDEARTIGRELVLSKLAACANIFDNMNSFYYWDGKLQDDTEAVLIAKTTKERVPQLIDKVKSLHSYECPCIVTLPVAGGNPAFLNWVVAETT
jgi:periplasmic divalent cation tolerance protein